MRLSLDWLGSIKISLVTFILKIFRELYSFRFRADINFLRFCVNLFVDFHSNACFEMKLFTLPFSCSRLITLENNFSSSYTCNSLIEQIP